MTWVDFLKKIAGDYELTQSVKKVFIEMYKKEGNVFNENDIAKQLSITEKTVAKHKSNIFDVFTKGNDCAESYSELDNHHHKADLLRQLLEEKYQMEQSQQSNASANEDKDYQDIIYQAALDSYQQQREQQLTSNDLLGGYEQARFRREEIYVPLALVRPTDSDKHKPQSEEKQRFEHEDFFNQIVRGRQGRTEGKHIAIIGEPGAGKTTTLHDIRDRLMKTTEPPEQQETQELAVWVSLADLQQRQSLEDYILNTWLKTILKVQNVDEDMKSALEEWFNSGRVWLLLDGVDEMASGDPKEVIKSYLTGWVESARVVLTCRLNVWQANAKLLGDFETYRLLEFDYPQQVHQFIDNWFRTSDAAKGERLKTALDTAELAQMRSLVRNPLLLAMLCRIWQTEEGKLPQTKARLFQRFVQWIYDWKDPSFKIVTEKQKELSKVLGRLAKRDIDEGGSRFRLQESILVEALGYPDNPDSKFHLALKLGLLNDVKNADELDTDEKVYAFFHPTFEEYFAALAIDDWRFFLKHIPDNPYHPDASYRIFEPKWEEVILLWLGREDVSSKDKEEFIQALMEFDGGCGNFYNLRAYFLAAKGIAEFKDCPRADEIVEQIVEWGFGSYIPQVLMWEIFAVLRETERTKAINALELLIQNSQARDINIWRATECLEAIDNGNPTAIDTLLNLFQNSQSRDTCWVVGSTLARIAEGKSKVIKAMVELLQNSESEDICMEAGRCLEQIGSGNRIAIEALELLIQNSPPGDNRTRAALTLGRINPGNIKAINFLVQLIQNFDSEDIRSLGEWNLEGAIWDLGDIGSGSLTAINTLVELIQNSPPEKILSQAVASLGQIGSGSLTAINTLVELIRNSPPEKILSQAVASLGQIDSGNLIAINALVELIHNSQDESIRLDAVSSLGKICSGNLIAINALVELIHNSQPESIRWQAALSLKKIGSDDPKVIDVLVELIHNSQDEYIRRQVAWSFWPIGSENPKVIAALVDALVPLIQNPQNESFIWLIGRNFRETGERYPTIIHALESLAQNSQSEDIRLQAAKSLVAIDKGNSIAINTLKSAVQNCPSSDSLRDGVVRSLTSILGMAQLEEVVTDLKDRLSNETFENDYKRYEYYYEIIWRCAQILPYPTFYQAWHRSPHTPHPEVPETSSVGFTPTSQSLDLAELPERLRAALDRNPDLKGAVQLICINGSKFANRDNPALRIYNEMQGQGCRKYWNGKPREMGELQDYWDDITRDSDRAVVLVFYENPTTTQDFSDTFLNALSTFDGRICVISDQPNIPLLKSFSPNRPNLVADVVEWVRNIVLENS